MVIKLLTSEIITGRPLILLTKDSFILPIRNPALTFLKIATDFLKGSARDRLAHEEDTWVVGCSLAFFLGGKDFDVWICRRGG